MPTQRERRAFCVAEFGELAGIVIGVDRDKTQQGRFPARGPGGFIFIGIGPGPGGFIFVDIGGGFFFVGIGFILVGVGHGFILIGGGRFILVGGGGFILARFHPPSGG